MNSQTEENNVGIHFDVIISDQRSRHGNVCEVLVERPRPQVQYDNDNDEMK